MVASARPAVSWILTSDRTHNDRRGALASLAAIGSVLVASSCCLPVLPFLLAAGFAGSSAVLNRLRPYLLVAAILFVAYGFYQSWRAKSCSSGPRVFNSVLLWISVTFVVVSTLFPQVLANAAADLLAK
jgi:hypothetical protein